MLTGDEVAAHNTPEDLWMIIDGHAYDLSDFASEHPGGAKILYKYAGKDATEEYDPIHPKGTIEKTLPKEKHLGPVDMSTVAVVKTDEAVKKPEGATMRLEECLNLDDFERAAEGLLKPKAWAYYASAADDERTKNWNAEAFRHIRFRPRTLIDVSKSDVSTKMLGYDTTLPIFVSPAAGGKLAHPEGELALVRAAGNAGIPYIVSANSSMSFEDVANEAVSGQTLFYQLYVNRSRDKTEEQLKKVVAAGFKGICVTVDAPIGGNRERDERAKLDTESASDPSMRASVAPVAQTSSEKKAQKPVAPPASLASQMFSYVDPTLTWKDLAWIRQVTNLPIIVKGIQTAEDAALCVKHGVEGIFLSNHGGRQLEGAPSAVETLLEIRKFEPHVFDKCEVYVDGGIRRGTDVLKALALGATAVGVGRGFMFSLVFGEAGVSKAIDILRAEIVLNLALLGGQSVRDLKPSMLNTRRLETLVYDGEYNSVTKSKL
ncbi:mitochondrial chaperone BCS1 [Pseudohyphozyma bogoriensis]|nr:mitochondrial chaperone BCS1 [Pseudohyphozyma bogoriensis]